MTEPPPKTSDHIAIIAACAFGTGISCLVMAGYVTGALVYPLHQAFGWSRSAIMLSYSVMTVATLVASFIVGPLYDRVRPRLIIVPSQIAFGCGYIAIGLFLNHDIRSFYLLHLILALAAAGSLPMIFTKIVASRFSANRGLALGIVSAATGVCGLLVPPAIVLLTENFGWRAAYMGMGLVPIFGALLISLPILPRQAIGAARMREAIGVSAPDLTLAEAMRGYRLWAISLPLAVASALSVGLIANLIPLLRDSGFDALRAATALSLLAGCVIVGRLMTGVLLDRFWAPWVALGVMTPAALALLVLASVHSSAATYASLVMIGIATGAEVDLLWYLGSRYFGLKQIGRIYTFMYICVTLGVGCGGPAFATVYDRTGSYNLALYAGATIWVTCAAILLSLGPYPGLRRGTIKRALSGSAVPDS